MVKHIVLRIVAGLVLLAAIAGIAFFAYQAGVTHAGTANIQVPASGTTYPLMYWHPFFGFGLFGLFIGLFLICLAFSALRLMLFGPRWGWRHMRHSMRWHGMDEHAAEGHDRMGRHGPWGEDVPPMVAEWHRRMHEQQPDDKKPEA